MKKLLVLLITGLFMFIGCKQSENLDGNWITSSFTKDGVAQEIAISNIEFQADNGVIHIGGCAGVNFFSGDIKVANGKIKTNDFALTRMMGDPAAMEFEDMFMLLLNNAESYKLSENTLIILAPSKNLEIELKRE